MKLYPWLFSLLLFAMLVGCGPRDPYRSVGQINMQDGGQGSGTLIQVSRDWGLVLSCRHVAVREGNQARITWPDGQQTAAEVVYVMKGNDYSTDIALLVCRRPRGISPLPVAKYDPSSGPFVMVGWRDYEFYESVQGRTREEGSVIRGNKPLVGGMSGGPCLNGNGEVVGIGVGSNRRDYSVATNGESLERVVAELSK